MKRTSTFLFSASRVLVIAAIVTIPETTILAHGVVDQSNLVTGGAQLILVHMPIGQEFIPTKPNLNGVDIVFRGSSFVGSDMITVNIRHQSIASPILATTSRVTQQCPFVSPFSCVEHFDFPDVLHVTTGDTYVIEVQTTMPIHGWQSGPGDYPRGAPIIQGVVHPELPDYGFQTYFQPNGDDLQICRATLGVCEDDLLQCDVELGPCQVDLGECGTDLAACGTNFSICESGFQDVVTELIEGHSGLQEIIRLLSFPPGRRSSNYSCSGELCPEIMKAISQLLAPPGQNY